MAAEYFSWKSESGVRVHIHLDAMDGIARDVIERSQGLPVEVGGLLLGQVTRGEKPAIWIERYQRVECEHRSGPNFVLESDELAGLETLAAGLQGDLSVVGFYRSHLRPGFGLEAPDRELIARYFRDQEDLYLLIGPAQTPEPGAAGTSSDLRAQFFTHASNGEVRAAEPVFPFRGRIAGPFPVQPNTVDSGPDQPQADPRERTERSVSKPVERLAGERLGRLVPDFIPSAPPPRPAADFFAESRPPISTLYAQTEDLDRQRGFLAHRWPLLAAILLVGAGAAVILQQAGHHAGAAATPAAETDAVRPLGLYVDPSGPDWRISWNSSATALQGARGVQLFVRDGDDQKRIDLSPQDLQSASYRYQAQGRDVTFRLEVTAADGRVSAESFRLLKTAEKTAAAQPPASVTNARAIHKVPPVVPSSFRPRIKGTMGVDVRVRIDTQGRVVSATPLTPISKAHSGLESFLAERAVAAAKQWRFEPARENGRPIPGVEIIHFTFER